MIGLMVGGYLGLVSGPQSPLLALAFMPGWFPGLLIAAYAANERATRYVRVRPIHNNTEIVLRAHPAFAAAMDAASKK